MGLIMNAVHAVLRVLKEAGAEISEYVSIIRRVMHKILMRVKGSIPVLDDGDHRHQATTFTRRYAASINRVGAVSDAYARKRAQQIFGYETALIDLHNVITSWIKGSAYDLPIALSASGGFDQLGLRALFNEPSANTEFGGALGGYFTLCLNMGVTSSQAVYPLIPALRSKARTLAAQQAAAAHRGDDDDDDDDDGGQGGAAAPPPQARPHGRNKKDDDDEPPEGPKGP
jgi:hypothetical protein